MLHSDKYCSGVHTNRTIKYRMRGYVLSMADTVKQYKNSEKNGRKSWRISRSRKISQEIRLAPWNQEDQEDQGKSSKKGSDSSSDNPDSNSLITGDSSWYTYRRPAGCKDINRLYHIVNGNLKNNKDQSNEAINSESALDTGKFNLSSGTSNPFPVVTISLRGGKKHIETTFPSLTCLWDSGDTGSMIKRRHTKNYERNMRYNKV